MGELGRRLMMSKGVRPDTHFVGATLGSPSARLLLYVFLRPERNREMAGTIPPALTAKAP